MKKTLAIILALASVLTFTACKDEEEKAAERMEDNKKAAVEKISRTKIIDEDDLTVEVTEISFNEDSEMELTVKIKNNSEDTAYSLSDEYVFVNGIELLCDLENEEEIAPGETAEGVLWVDSGEYEKYGLYNYSEIEVKLTAYNEDYDEVYTDTAFIYPNGEKKAESFERSDKYLGKVLFDNKYVKAQLLDTVNGDPYIFFENKHSAEVEVWCEDFVINGNEDDDARIHEYIPGDRAVIGPLYYANVESIKSLEFDLIIEDEDGELLDDTVTYSAE